MEVYDIFDLTVVTVKCLLCGQTHSVKVNKEDFVDYNSGLKPVQDCFPYLSLDERELLMSGICVDCFEKIYKDEED